MRPITLTGFFLLSSTLFGQEIFSPRDPGETPNRTYDVLHYKIEVNVLDRTKSVDGTVTTTLVPLMSSLKTVRFHAGEMTIKKVRLGKGREGKRHSAQPAQISPSTSIEPIPVATHCGLLSSTPARRSERSHSTDPIRVTLRSARKSGRKAKIRRTISGFPATITPTTNPLPKLSQRSTPSLYFFQTANCSP